LYSLLCKYLLNEADAVERQWVDSWLQGNTANKAALEGVRKMLHAPMPAQFSSQTVDTEASWQRLLNTIQPEVKEAPVFTLPETKKTGFRWYYAAAAVAVIAVGLSLYNMIYKEDAAVKALTGQLVYTLPDGSIVKLDSLSEITVAGDFGKKGRTVYLRGKAFFDITANEKQPFEVRMNDDMKVRVLGTQFTIDFRENIPLNIHVASGKIMVMSSKQNRSVVLTPGMLLHQDEPGVKPEIVEHVLDVEKIELSFNDAPLSEVLETVETMYDVKFEVKDATLLTMPVKTTFSNEPIEKVLETLEFMTNTTIESKAPGLYIIE
jgi:ferric-dicitrate binding protein FerR (iron transport regulator)